MHTTQTTKWAALRQEHGSMSIAAAGVIFVGVVAILPLVWNLGSIWTIRRQSQTSSDAAALAAAESIARRLNGQSQDWWDCVPPETPQTIVQAYVGAVVAPAAQSQLGRPAAEEYAATNRGTLTQYSQHIHPMGADGVHAKLVDSVVVPPIHVDLDGSVTMRGTLAPAGASVAGKPVHSGTTAETYLHQVRSWETPCPFDPEAVAQHYQFRWRIRLVETGW